MCHGLNSLPDLLKFAAGGLAARFCAVPLDRQVSHMKPTKFELFFVRCIQICAKEFIGPDDYVWDFNNPGIWLEKFKAGMTETDAVKSVFETH
jgi:hypothetical protein